MRVLDVGCGPGTITLDLAEAVAPTGAVIGIENVEGPLEQARPTPPHEVTTRTRFELADVMELPYADASFDVVHAHQVLQHLADPVGALREMARVTRPGGLVAVRDVDYASMVWHPASEGMTRWLGVYRRLARLNHAEPDAGRHLVAWAHAAGLDPAQAVGLAVDLRDAGAVRVVGWHLGAPHARVDLRDAGARARARDAPTTSAASAPPGRRGRRTPTRGSR